MSHHEQQAGPSSSHQILPASGLQYMADFTVRALTDLTYIKVRYKQAWETDPWQSKGGRGCR